MKKIRNSIILAALLTTSSVMAYGNNNHNSNSKMQMQNNIHGQHHKKNHKKNVVHFIMKTVSSMDLSKEQMAKFSMIKKNSKNSKFIGFSENGFDKELYISSRIKTKEDRVKKEAQLIDSIYSILNKKQITYIGMKINAMEKHRNQYKN